MAVSLLVGTSMFDGVQALEQGRLHLEAEVAIAGRIAVVGVEAALGRERDDARLGSVCRTLHEGRARSVEDSLVKRARERQAQQLALVGKPQRHAHERDRAGSPKVRGDVVAREP